MITYGNRPQPRILVAGIGNIFMGDDAFGVRVAQRLAECSLPEDVHVADFGIRGLDLAYALMDEYELTIFVDTTQRGGTPGTLYVIEPDLNDLQITGDAQCMLDAHAMDPVKVLRMAMYLGARLRRILLVGCEPGDCGSATEGLMGLTEPVESALEGAVQIVNKLITQFLTPSQSQRSEPRA